MVIEYIKLVDSLADLPQRVAGALRWIAEVPSPPDHVFGPLGGGCISHGFFKDDEAPLEFTSIEALKRYIEKVGLFSSMHHRLTFKLVQGRQKISGQVHDQVKPISFKGKQLIFMQSYVDSSNFGMDQSGNSVILDLAGICMLPVSFALFTRASDPSITPLSKMLGLSRNPNGASMARISGILWMMSDSTLGV